MSTLAIGKSSSKGAWEGLAAIKYIVSKKESMSLYSPNIIQFAR